MTVKPLSDAHLARMLAEHRRRIGRAEDDLLTPRPPEATTGRASTPGDAQ